MYRRCFFVSFAALVCLALSAAQVPAVPITGGTGPGGFEMLGGGPSALRLWFTGSNIDGLNNSTLTPGGAVNTWVNLAIPGSHNANAVNAPIYQTTDPLNGHTRVFFDGTNNRKMATDFIVSANDSYTVFAIADRALDGSGNPVPDPTTSSCCNAIVSAGNAVHRHNALFLDNPSAAGAGGPNAIVYHGHGSAGEAENTSTGFADGSSHVLVQQYHQSTNGLTGYFDGISPGTINPPGGSGSVGGTFLIGGENNSGARSHIGTITEVVHFNRTLNSAERIIVENHLSAKYALPLAANKFYTGDSPGNGDHDHDVFGIGRASDGSAVTNAGSAGLGIEANPLALNNNHWVLAGHNGVINGLTTADLGGGLNNRWERVWFIEHTGSVDVTLTFDASDSGLSALTDLSNYRLLYRPGLSGDFNPLAVLSVASGDQISFIVPAGMLSTGFFTIGEAIIPEPSTLLLAGLGGLMVLFRRRRNRP